MLRPLIRASAAAVLLSAAVAGCSSSSNPAGASSGFDPAQFLRPGQYRLIVITTSEQAAGCIGQPNAFFTITSVATVTRDGETWTARASTEADGDVELRLRRVGDLSAAGGPALILGRGDRSRHCDWRGRWHDPEPLVRGRVTRGGQDADSGIGAGYGDRRHQTEQPDLRRRRMPGSVVGADTGVCSGLAATRRDRGTHVHSARSVVAGSTTIARRTGIHVATPAASVRIPATAAYANGSNGLSP
jgi:hypothetical protein